MIVFISASYDALSGCAKSFGLAEATHGRPQRRQLGTPPESGATPSIHPQ